MATPPGPSRRREHAIPWTTPRPSPRKGDRAMPFSPDSEVDVTELEDVKEWALLRELEYQGKQDPYTVPVGQHTDFASVPRVFAWFIPPYGRYTKAAILHDYLWRVRAAQGEMKW